MILSSKKHKLTWNNPVPVFNFLAGSDEEVDTPEMMEVQAFVLLPKLLCDPARASFLQCIMIPMETLAACRAGSKQLRIFSPLPQVEFQPFGGTWTVAVATETMKKQTKAWIAD